MDNVKTYKPIFWRLLVYRFFPFYTGWIIVQTINKINNDFSTTSFLIQATFVIFALTLTMAYFMRKKFYITINKDEISGLGTGWGLPTEKFLISDLDFSYQGKQSFYEKINFYQTIRSSSGQKIVVIDFLFGKPIADEIYKTAKKMLLDNKY